MTDVSFRYVSCHISSSYNATVLFVIQIGWLVHMKGYHVFDGLRIPERCSITWRMPEGDFTSADIMIKKIIYDGDVVKTSM